MKERPIIFSGPMVSAILEGRKTQTRRAVKGDVNGYEGVVIGTVAQERGHLGKHCFIRGDESAYQSCPYGEAGDRLWVREAWAVDAPLDQVRREREDALPVEPIFGHGPYYRADGVHENTGLTWRPSIHMPRWASRLALVVTAVRVERLLAISVDDCFAEGIEAMRCPQCHLACYGLSGWGHDDLQKTPIEAYWHLWDQINEARGYGRAKNPWCWVLEFRRLNHEEREAA